MDRTHAVCSTNGEIGGRAARLCMARLVREIGTRRMRFRRAPPIVSGNVNQKPNMLLRMARASAVAWSSTATVRTATFDFSTFAATVSVSALRNTVNP